MKKTVLITGASRGIGRAIAKEFAWHAYNVVINYHHSEKEAINLKEKLERDYNVEVLTIKADVSNEEEVESMILKVINKFDTIDVLVNNAGIAIDSDLEDKTVEDFKRVIDVNLLGTFLVSKYAGQNMLKNQSGKIINISSTNGIDTNYPRGMDYDASKAGVISLTHNFANLLAPYVNVNAIASGWVNTETIINMEETYKAEEQKKILLERFATPDEIAKVVYFLASDEASYINSTVIRVDGGLK